MKQIFLIKQNLAFDANYLANLVHNGCQVLEYDDYAITIVGTNEEILECARKCNNDDCIVYAVGDDQEVNCVLNGIINGNAKLGIIPVGDKNDFYRSLDEYQSDIINSNVMQVEGVYALNNFNIGMNADIYFNMERLKKLGLSHNILYNLGLLYTTFKIDGYVMGINDFWEKNILLSIANGTYVGGGYPISPRAGIHHSDVSVVTLNSDIPRSKIPRFWLDMINRQCETNQYTTVYTGDKEIVVETKDVVNAELDGILLQGDRFTVIPNAKKIEVVNNRRLIRELRK